MKNNWNKNIIFYGSRCSGKSLQFKYLNLYYLLCNKFGKRKVRKIFKKLKKLESTTPFDFSIILDCLLLELQDDFSFKKIIKKIKTRLLQNK